LFTHKEKIIKSSKLSEEDVVRLFYTILKNVAISREELIDESIRFKAFELCRDIDETDSPHVALTLSLNGLLWTGDMKLKNGLKKKGFDLFFS